MISSTLTMTVRSVSSISGIVEAFSFFTVPLKTNLACCARDSAEELAGISSSYRSLRQDRSNRYGFRPMNLSRCLKSAFGSSVSYHKLASTGLFWLQTCGVKSRALPPAHEPRRNDDDAFTYAGSV